MSESFYETKNQRTLVVDLDGTLIRTDLLYESLLWSLSRKPSNLLRGLGKLLRFGPSGLKYELSRGYRIRAEYLPFRREVIDLIASYRAKGSRVVLATAANVDLASQVADHLNLFDEVFASSETVNNSSETKADAIVAKFGKNNFDYVGDGPKDKAIWSAAKIAFVAGAKPSQVQKLGGPAAIALGDLVKVPQLRAAFGAMRIRQWLKNSLLFVPAVTAHQINLESFIDVSLAFLSFGLVASSIYVLNDLLDIDSDRLSKTKNSRPIAAGHLSVPLSFLISLSSAAVGLLIGWGLSHSLLMALCAYFIFANVYSLLLKKFLVVDVTVLALLYVFRIYVGAIVIQVDLSFWLLTFSFFFFLGLAFLKRSSEIQNLGGSGATSGRAYLEQDLHLVMVIGVTSSLLSVLIFALYIDSDAVKSLYSSPFLLWLGLPVLVYWTGWMWVQCVRGNVREDPVLFATSNRESIIAGLLFLILFAVAQFPI